MNVERDLRRVIVYLVETGAGPDVRESMDRIEAWVDGRPLPLRECSVDGCQHPAEPGRATCGRGWHDGVFSSIVSAIV